MTKDQYIPHEISMRSTTEVMNLIEKEGPAGYGIYWALMEYLRVQDGYIGDIQALKTLKRELKIRQTKLDKVLQGRLSGSKGNGTSGPSRSKERLSVL